MSELRVAALRGADIALKLEALADLRITVFREWPYLYEGSADYERQYLQPYLQSPQSLAILVWEAERCIGASTVLPLSDAEAPARQPFIEKGYALERIAYFGESVILRSYRGRGLGVKFFELREAHARELGLSICAFCSVDRPADHPARPADHVSNDAFWTRRGYRKLPALTASFSWPDIGEAHSSEKTLTFWLREL